MKALLIFLLPISLFAMDLNKKVLTDCEETAGPSMKNGVVTVKVKCKWKTQTDIYGEMEYLVETKASCALKNYDENDPNKCVSDEKYPIHKTEKLNNYPSDGSKRKGQRK